MVTLHDIMSVDVLTVSPEATLREIAQLLSDEHISGVPVVQGERVLGVISASDLLGFDADSRGVPTAREEGRLEPGEETEAADWREGDEPVAGYYVEMWENAGADVSARFGATEGPEWDVLEEHTAGELMTRTLVSLPPDTDAREGARYMLRTGVRRLLVMEDERLLGVVSTTDFVKAVAQHGLAG